MSTATATGVSLPVSLITGFLGSGKTTLVNRLLRHPAMSETAVIVNEFGEIGLDHHLIESVTDEVVVMNSGCLCCTVRDDLGSTLKTLFLRRVRGEIPQFQRVLIETTGLADPAPIIHTLMRDPLVEAYYRLDGVVSTVDAVNGWRQLDRNEESVKQAAVADRIILTKTDLAEPEARARLEARLRRLNPGAPILTAVNGEIDPAGLFDAGLYNPSTKTADVQGWLRAEAYADEHHHDHDHGHAHDHDHHHDHAKLDVNRHDENIRAVCLILDEPIDWEPFSLWLSSLAQYRGEDLLRVKGVLNVRGQEQPVAVHGVQHLFHPPALLPAWPDADRRSKLVMIVRGMDRAYLEASLAAYGKPAETAPAGA